MSFLDPITSFLSIGPTRSFSGFKGYVTIQESTTDAMEITQQPVQQGATIADHAFKKPVTLSIQMQFNTALNIPIAGGLIGGIFGKSLRQIYQDLLDLQSPVPPNVLTPFTINTLKRSYPNMLIQTLGCTTDKRTENVLAINITFQEVILVPIGVGTINPSVLKKISVNAATQNVGKQSVLFTGAQALGFR